MALKMRPTGLSSGFYEGHADYGVFCAIGTSAASTKSREGLTTSAVLGAALPQQAGEPAHGQSRGITEGGDGLGAILVVRERFLISAEQCRLGGMRGAWAVGRHLNPTRHDPLGDVT
jgi:hypothetical protein